MKLSIGQTASNGNRAIGSFGFGPFAWAQVSGLKGGRGQIAICGSNHLRRNVAALNA